MCRNGGRKTTAAPFLSQEEKITKHMRSIQIKPSAIPLAVLLTGGQKCSFLDIGETFLFTAEDPVVDRVEKGIAELESEIYYTSMEAGFTFTHSAGIAIIIEDAERYDLDDIQRRDEAEEKLANALSGGLDA